MDYERTLWHFSLSLPLYGWIDHPLPFSDLGFPLFWTPTGSFHLCATTRALNLRYAPNISSPAPFSLKICKCSITFVGGHVNLFRYNLLALLFHLQHFFIVIVLRDDFSLRFSPPSKTRRYLQNAHSRTSLQIGHAKLSLMIPLPFPLVHLTN